jgi:phenolic acid decarboxylase
MRYTKFLIILLSFFIGVAATANCTEIDLSKTTINPHPVEPRVQSMVDLGVYAAINDTEVSIDFSLPVGIATITITNETGAIVYQQFLDTNSTLESNIYVGGWDSGNYTLTIQYENVLLTGHFLY